MLIQVCRSGGGQNVSDESGYFNTTGSIRTITGYNHDCSQSSDYYAIAFRPQIGISSPSTLPVSWHNFKATKILNNIGLNWSTASEQNTRDFEVQHSTNTQDWSMLGTVNAAGNSTTTRQYSFIHASPHKGGVYNYYRIKQRDVDDKYSYSKIVSIRYDETGPEVQVYPNPVLDVLNVYISESQQIRLLNLAGATVWQGWMNAGLVGYFWSSTTTSDNNSRLLLFYDANVAIIETYFRSDGYPVRCIKN